MMLDSDPPELASFFAWLVANYRRGGMAAMVTSFDVLRKASRLANAFRDGTSALPSESVEGSGLDWPAAHLSLAQRSKDEKALALLFDAFRDAYKHGGAPGVLEFQEPGFWLKVLYSRQPENPVERSTAMTEAIYPYLSARAEAKAVAGDRW